MELETVLYQKDGNVGVVTLNRTKAMNSLNRQIFADLTTAFQAARDDDIIRCVVLNAQGRAFCAGGDIAEMKGITTEKDFFDFMSVAGGFTTLLNTFPKPVVAAAQGAIAGAGVSLLMASDIALVAEDAAFIVAFGQVGLIPDCACHYLLPRIVGLNKAKELMLTQRPVKAAEMKELDAYAWSKGVRLVPNQNSFGHLQSWLDFPAYKPLAETPNGFAIDHPKMSSKRAAALCPRPVFLHIFPFHHHTTPRGELHETGSQGISDPL